MLYAAIVLIPIIYSIVMWYLAYKWTRIPQVQASTDLESTELPSFSVIIAARNEEENLPVLLATLQRLDYPNDKFEVIIVDDHSEDSTFEIASSSPLIKAVKLLDSYGKKEAIELGVSHSERDWVIVTDADCEVPTSWLKEYASWIEPDIHLLFAPIILSGNGVFQNLQSMEQSALIGIGAVASDLGKPFMLNAANMAFRRDTFNAVNGYSDNKDVPTGDDQYLLQAILTDYVGGVKFIKSDKLIVVANPSSKISQFINQRTRWASKWKTQSSPLIPTLIWGFYLCVITFLAVIVVDGNWIYLVPIGIKWSSDFILISLVQRFLKIKTTVTSFVFAQILYPFYAILIGILANLGSYSWKGRKYKT